MCKQNEIKYSSEGEKEQNQESGGDSGYKIGNNRIDDSGLIASKSVPTGVPTDRDNGDKIVEREAPTNGLVQGQ